jgi:hypothetical protein
MATISSAIFENSTPRSCLENPDNGLSSRGRRLSVSSDGGAAVSVMA